MPCKLLHDLHVTACMQFVFKMAEKVAVSILGEASKVIHEPSVLRRLLFASALLPADTPKLWEIIAKFAACTANSDISLLPKEAKSITENITFIDDKSLATDHALLKELIFMPFGGREHLGMILISDKQRCVLCNGKLLLRADRPSNITLYTDSYGTLPALHYRKYCANSRKGCNVVQHYGYYTRGLSQLHFNSDWDRLQYFVSSQETAFELQILRNFDYELLIGLVSYKQRAEIYNAIHGYEAVKKRCSTAQEVGTDSEDPSDEDNS